MTGREWVQQHAIAWDQLINTIPRGYADETLSARAWRNRDKNTRWRIARRMIDALFFWQQDHCYHAHQSEIIRRHLPVEYRE